MQLRPDVQIPSIIKALSDVVLPAVDPGNKLAQEQTRIVIGLLTLMSQQGPVQSKFDRDELSRLMETGQALAEAAGSEAALTPAKERLVAVVADAREVFYQSRLGPEDVLQAIRGLREVVGAMAGSCYASAHSASIQSIVLAYTREQGLRDRAMLLMQGWEPDPEAVPSLGELLSPG